VAKGHTHVPWCVAATAPISESALHGLRALQVTEPCMRGSSKSASERAATVVISAGLPKPRMCEFVGTSRA